MCGSAGWKSEIQVSAELVSVEGWGRRGGADLLHAYPLASLGWLAVLGVCWPRGRSPCSLPSSLPGVLPGCLCVNISVSYKAISHIALGIPLITSF